MLASQLYALVQITSAGLWSHNEYADDAVDDHDTRIHSEIEKLDNTDVDDSPRSASKSWLSWIMSDIRRVKSPLEFWNTDNGVLESQSEVSISSERYKSASDDVTGKVSKDVPRSRFSISPKESLRAAIIHIGKKWHGRLSFFLRLARRILGGLWVRIYDIFFSSSFLWFT